MQECPDPITKLTWDNAAIISTKLAQAKKIGNGEVVKIELKGRAIEIPALIVPGTADWSVILPLGYGRTRSGVLGNGVGVNTYALRTSDAMGFATGAKISKTGKTHRFALTENHGRIAEHHLEDLVKERGIVREGTWQEYQNNPEMHTLQQEDIHTAPRLEGEHQWGMAIDMSACVGCTACIVACQAENNVPVVGKDEVIKGRQMHWLRLDRYFSGDPRGEVNVAMQVMLCQHCENAPCEPVCPVNATVHSPEGLNEMVYNRCVGTRYCSNNCPYKVRRFNFFDYNKNTLRQSPEARDGKVSTDPTSGFTRPQVFQAPMEELLKMQKNPNVTVRMRGVMEKCTYCVQRIQEAKIAGKVEAGLTAARKVPDGAVVTACQQACPTQAIVFGDVSDQNSRVSTMKKSGRNYEVLEHLNVRPRTTYLSRLKNPNAKMGEVRA
jgi:molybdopterin-containing oxidoreductase family iron-sulfur binding subunit